MSVAGTVPVPVAVAGTVPAAGMVAGTVAGMVVGIVPAVDGQLQRVVAAAQPLSMDHLW